MRPKTEFFFPPFRPLSGYTKMLYIMLLLLPLTFVTEQVAVLVPHKPSSYQLSILHLFLLNTVIFVVFIIHALRA